MNRKATFIVIALVATTAALTFAEERYTVAMGDSLSKIGKQFGVPYRDIMAVNQLRSTSIYAGQILTIPTKGSAVQASTPARVSEPVITSQVDRYRSLALTDKAASPAYDRISPPPIGEYAGEASIPIVPQAAPSAYAKPLHTYPPVSQERYKTPTLPGSTEVSPYNGASAPRSQPAQGNYSRMEPPRGATRIVPASTKRGGTYIVQRGDSVRSISKEHGISFWDLRTANGIELKRIYPGQILKIPVRSRF